MKQLGNKLTLLRGKLGLEEAAAKTGLSRETLRKIEAGQPVKLETLRKICFGLGGSQRDWIEMECTWLEWHARHDADKISISPIVDNSRLRDPDRALRGQITTQLGQLSTKEQRALLLAMKRPPVLRSIAELNRLFEASTKG